MKTIALILLLITSSRANAYLDPGSTSLVIQGLIAALASAATVASIYWAKICSFFRGLFRSGAEEDQVEETVDE